MGEHLKGKQQGLIRQRFENYLQITRLEPESAMSFLLRNLGFNFFDHSPTLKDDSIYHPFGGGNSKIFLNFSPRTFWGQWIQFDGYIFLSNGLVQPPSRLD